jgi:hypothetical protein
VDGVVDRHNRCMNQGSDASITSPLHVKNGRAGVRMIIQCPMAYARMTFSPFIYKFVYICCTCLCVNNKG